MRRDPVSRRRFVRAAGGTVGLGSLGVLAGCLDDDGDDGDDGGVPGAAATIEVGPDGALWFVPADVTIRSGETVVWTFESTGHNVSADPDHTGKASIPDGAEPFASYEGDRKFETVARGERFSHTFETTGEYQYVCIPHASQEMVGTVTVE